MTRVKRRSRILDNREWNHPASLDSLEELKRCEKIIQKGLKSFMEVGHCLMTIRDKQLYRADFATFEGYCRDRWGISRPYAYKLMAGAKVVDELSAEGDIVVLPDNVSQVRKLTLLSKEDRITAWKRVVCESIESGNPITAKSVQNIVTDIRPDQIAHEGVISNMSTNANRENHKEIDHILKDLDNEIESGDLVKIAKIAKRLRRELCL